MGMKSKLAITFAYDSENPNMCGDDCPYRVIFKNMGHCELFKGVLRLSNEEEYDAIPKVPKTIRCGNCLEAQRKWDKKIDRINKAEQGGK